MLTNEFIFNIIDYTLCLSADNTNSRGKKQNMTTTLF